MSPNITDIGAQKVRSVANGEAVEIKSFWENQDVAIVFFRRWGCMLCRLWAKELSEITPVLKRNNVKLVGVGVEEVGSKDFVKGQYFDGDLFYVENISTYKMLGFKRFNFVSIMTSLFWKQSREALSKGRSMDLGGNMMEGDLVQTGGAILVKKGGNLVHHFVQNGPGDHLSNEVILKNFGLESEYVHETMANKKRDEAQCTVPTGEDIKRRVAGTNKPVRVTTGPHSQKSKPRYWAEALKTEALGPIHEMWTDKQTRQNWV